MIEVLFVVFFMFVWFQTDVLVDYGRAFRLTKALMIDQWEEWRESRPRDSYLTFLSLKRRGFFTKLLSCELCLGFWLSLVSCHFGVGILWTPAVYLVSILAYKIYVWLIWKLRKS